MELNNVMDFLNSADVNHKKVEEGGDFKPVPEGNAVVRFVSYIEFGPQPQQFKGVDKGNAEECFMEFEVIKHFADDTVSGELLGTKCRISFMAKSNFKKWFNNMSAGNAQSMPHMLGRPFVVTVTHNKSGDKTYANISTIAPAVDPTTGMPANVPPAKSPIKVFLWSNPVKEHWDALFIDGETEKDDGTKVSKNWMQERIIKGPCFNGSALHTLLAGTVNVDTSAITKVENPQVQKPQPQVQQPQTVQPQQTVSTQQPTTAPSIDSLSSDDLNALFGNPNG